MATTYELIASTVLGSSATEIEFTSIPGTGYTDLMLLCSLRSDRSSSINDNVQLTFNGSGSNYSERTLYGQGNSVASYANTGVSNLVPFFCTATTATSDTFASAEIYVPNYAGSTNKSVSSTGVHETNGTVAYAVVSAGLWSDTSAITSLKLAPQTGTNFVAGSSAYLYGITKS